MYFWMPERGSGSHGTLYLGERFTIVNNIRKELGPGLLADMCQHLGFERRNFDVYSQLSRELYA